MITLAKKTAYNGPFPQETIATCGVINRSQSLAFLIAGVSWKKKKKKAPFETPLLSSSPTGHLYSALVIVCGLKEATKFPEV